MTIPSRPCIDGKTSVGCSTASLAALVPVARESYRISRNAFSTSGIVSQGQIEEFPKMDAEIAKIPAPLRATAVFDCSLQHEVNSELAINDELSPPLRFGTLSRHLVGQLRPGLRIRFSSP
jgi:hypothetical protein